MGSELPNLYWLLSKEFITKYAAEHHIEEAEDFAYTIVSDLQDRLKLNGQLSPNPNGWLTSGMLLDNQPPLITFRQQLLRCAALNKEWCEPNRLPVVNFLVDIPEGRGSLTYMDHIVKIARGVRTFIKPVILFVDSKGDCLKVEI